MRERAHHHAPGRQTAGHAEGNAPGHRDHAVPQDPAEYRDPASADRYSNSGLARSSPEQQESAHDAEVPADVYSLGVTWIELLNGNALTPHAVGAGVYELPALREGVRELIGRMCAYATTDRPTIDEIQEAIRASCGSGLAQLALAILLAVTDQATAERFYQRFKWSVLAPIEVDHWSLDAGDVLGWLESAAGTDDFVGLTVET